ncbi:hypothetical protein HOK00_03400 [bacterium]|nr:hypothetical protein [bacterium]
MSSHYPLWDYFLSLLFVLKLVDRLANISDLPSEKYLKDTINMMNFLLKNREELSETQILIINDIKDNCF